MTSEHYPPRADLEAAFQAVRRARVPQIPDVVLALREELIRPEPCVKVAADLIAQDPALTGQLLKMINSPLFAARTKISSVQQAITMIGIERLTNLVTASAIQRMLGANEGAARMVWESTMEQARVAVAIAERVPEVSADTAYLFGMMQNVGSLIFADLLTDYGTVWALRNISAPDDLLRYERTALGIDHATVGFLLAGNWRLPEPVALAIYHHHSATAADLDDPETRALIAISKLVHYLIALSLGIHEQPEMLAYRDAAWQELTIRDEDWSALCDQAMQGGWTH